MQTTMSALPPANRPCAGRLVAGLLASAVLFPAAGARETSPPGGPGPASDPPRLVAPLSAGEEVALPALDPEVPSPAEFLGYPLGTRFTHYPAILAYLERLAQASPRVTIRPYGETYEGRPLELVAISSPENIDRLEEIRLRHLRLAAPALLAPEEQEALTFTQPAILWLAYGVHGNESSSAEAAMGAAYVLAAAQGDWERLLREVIVLIDPLSNPDGRERYLSGYEQRRGRLPDPDPAAAEHTEPWPGGRYNHYLIDLNRDWAWASQKETRHRLAAFRQWEPQVYVDLHEMGSGSTYFFPPVADPVNPSIDKRVLPWLQVFGRANSRVFDRQGWIFFNSQRYDLFYPGYGDSYPALRGAVGMTYEMAGGGRAGEILRLPDGSLLTLADRLARHLASSLATVETAAENRVALLKDYVASRRAASTRLAQSVLWEAGQPESRALAELLALHGVEVNQLVADVEVLARPGAGGTEEKRRFPNGTYVVSTAQPLAALIEALLRVESPLPPDFVERQRQRVADSRDTEFYDVTAWSLPLAYNLSTWWIEGEAPAIAPFRPPAGGLAGAGDVGYLLSPQGVAGYRFAAALGRQGVRTRLALVRFEAGGIAYPEGTLFIPRLGNGEGLEERLLTLAAEHRVTLRRVASSATQTGISLGSDELVPVRRSRVGLVGGGGVSATSFGGFWHLLSEGVGMDVRRLELGGVVDALPHLEVLVLPDGSDYGEVLSERQTKAMAEWVKAGGVLVVVGDAVTWADKAGIIEIETWKPPEDDGETHEGGAALSPLAGRPLSTPGAILSTSLRASHPMAAGVLAPPPTMFSGSTIVLPTLPPEETVLTVAAEKPVASGLVWEEARERLAGSLLVADHPSGKGRVVAFAQDPVFRLLFRGTMPLFLNAVMYGPSW